MASFTTQELLAWLDRAELEYDNGPTIRALRAIVEASEPMREALERQHAVGFREGVLRERERCAKVAEDFVTLHRGNSRTQEAWEAITPIWTDIAEHIRAALPEPPEGG